MEDSSKSLEDGGVDSLELVSLADTAVDSADSGITGYTILEGDLNAGASNKKLKLKVDGSLLKFAMAREMASMRDMRMRGFNSSKDKVPEAVLNTLVGQERLKIAQSIIGDVCEKICKDFRYVLLSDPSCQVLEWEPDLVFALEMNIAPDFALPDLGSFSISGYSCNISDEDVKKERDYVLNEVKFPTEAGEGAIVELGDTVTFDSCAKFGEKSVQDLCANNQAIRVSEEKDARFLGIPEQLVGITLGGSKKITIVVPDDYKSKSFRGREVDVELSVKKINKRLLAKDLADLLQRSGVASEEALNNNIRAQLQRQSESHMLDLQAEELKNKICELCDFTPPGSDGKPEDKFAWIVSKYGRQHGVEVTQQDVEKTLLARMTGNEAYDKSIIMFYRQVPEAMKRLTSSIYSAKSTSLMVHRANKVSKEISYADLKEAIIKLKTKFESSGDISGDNSGK